ncbi:MAG: TROVE domain-containing protein [Bryobacterales bacterium]
MRARDADGDAGQRNAIGGSVPGGRYGRPGLPGGQVPPGATAGATATCYGWVSHPKTDGARNALFGWAAYCGHDRGPAVGRSLPWSRASNRREQPLGAGGRGPGAQVRAHEREKAPDRVPGLREVWLALFERMPLGALVRNLATLTRVGVLAPLSDETAWRGRAPCDAQALRQARLHPVAILASLLTYSAGQGARGRHD